MTTRSLWVHEDEEGMRRLWPASALPYLAADVQDSIDAAERNAAPNGMGFSDMRRIEAPDASFAPEGLTRDVVMTGLGALLPRFQRLQVGDGKYYGFVDDDALCFGFDNMCFIYGDVHDGLVCTFFFNAWTDDPAQSALLRQAIETIDALCPAAVVDYWVHMAGAVSDRTFMDRYFAALAGRIANPEGFDSIRNASRRDDA